MTIAWVALLAGPAAAITVSAFAPYTPTPTAKVWYENDVRFDGTASIVDLTGQGGNLESNQPLPIGAALLTTGASNTDKAEVGVTDSYGLAPSMFNDSTLSLQYEYYKDSTNDGNAFAAPSIKLTLYNPGCGVGVDCFGTLVYEPTWNQPANPAASLAVPTDDWISVSITEDSGLFWWTGGFGQPNTAGGPPLKTLSGWAAVFNGDFAGASVVLLSMGVGTYNLSQTGYFDDVRLSYTGFSEAYDFEPIPEPGTLLLVGTGLVGLQLASRRRA